MTETPIDTGLTGAVTNFPHEREVEIGMNQPMFNPPAVVTPMPEGWTLQKVAALVRDLAMNLYEEAFTLKKHGLTQAEFDVLKTNEFFKNAIEQATIEWQSPQSTSRRLALESAIAVEDALPTIAARLSKPTEPLSDVVALLKVLSEIAGVIGSKAASQPQVASEKFKIVINLGSDTLQRATAPTIVVDHVPTSTGGLAISPFPQGT